MGFDLIEDLITHRKLDVIVGDDTMVDYIKLEINTVGDQAGYGVVINDPLTGNTSASIINASGNYALPPTQILTGVATFGRPTFKVTADEFVSMHLLWQKASDSSLRLASFDHEFQFMNWSNPETEALIAAVEADVDAAEAVIAALTLELAEEQAILADLQAAVDVAAAALVVAEADLANTLADAANPEEILSALDAISPATAAVAIAQRPWSLPPMRLSDRCSTDARGRSTLWL